MIQDRELIESRPIEEEDQMEYGFMNEAMDDDSQGDDEPNEDDTPTKSIDDDPDNLDDEY
ncbi:MAG: hypothetical protein VX527_07065 [Planctomycetota bacterium]|nr:hypothetical protein [Planctomycetota bacterium]